MGRRSSAAIRLLLVASLVLFPVFLSRASFAAEDSLQPTRSRIAALHACLDSYGAAATVDKLNKGLILGAWAKPGPAATGKREVPPPPAEYLDSLDVDLRACDFASQPDHAAQRRLILNAVFKDLNIKIDDCRKFGMGRKVVVRVTTSHGESPDHGWVVFYKWLSASAFATSEIRFPQVTSPSVIQLAPGEYVFRVEKKLPNSQLLKLDPATVVVAYQPAVDVQFPIP